jgi:Xaa-Pro dipeptidase
VCAHFHQQKNDNMFSMGLETYKISVNDLFVGNRRRLLASVREKEDTANSVIYLRGGPSTTRFDTDHEPLFRQESYFLWIGTIRIVKDIAGPLFVSHPEPRPLPNCCQ